MTVIVFLFSYLSPRLVNGGGEVPLPEAACNIQAAVGRVRAGPGRDRENGGRARPQPLGAAARLFGTGTALID